MEELRSIGIQPDILLCRTDREIPHDERRKLAPVLQRARDARSSRRATRRSIYAVPLAYHQAGLDSEVLAAFGIETAPDAGPDPLDDASPSASHNPEGEVTIAIVGKYTGLKDAYKSLIEALHHGGIANRVKVKLDWIESEVFESEDPAPFLEGSPRHPRAGRLRPARRRGQDPRGRASPASARCRISASASACRWR